MPSHVHGWNTGQSDSRSLLLDQSAPRGINTASHLEIISVSRWSTITGIETSLFISSGGDVEITAQKNN